MSLDFSDILSDPDVAGQSFTVVRRTDTVGANGRSVLSTASFPNQVGAVTPGDPGNLLRKEDSAMADNVITVSTVFRLRAMGDGVQPDQIIYDGMTYTVKSVKRWGRMANMTKAVAVSQNASDPDPS